MAKISDIKKVLISRTDAIGDVMLTLPMAGLLKRIYGTSLRIAFFGKTYTENVIRSSVHVDEFYNYDAFTALDAKGRIEFMKEIEADVIIHVFPREDIALSARQAGITHRIGTTHRLYHLWNCNHLVALGRKNSPFHEAQLNTFLLKDLGLEGIPSKEELSELYGFSRIPSLPENYKELLSNSHFNLILHPGSNESAREWNLVHYRDLIHFMEHDKIRFIITGSEKEYPHLKNWLQSLPPETVNLVGKLSLDEMIALIQHCDGLIAASTGPLHIAAALGKHSLGIFPPIRPMHPGRWSPMGSAAEYAVVDKICNDCRNAPKQCHCINEISAAMISDRVRKWIA